MEKAGYNFETVETGKDAIEKLQNQKFNVCLVDVRLPDIDGTELLLKMADTPEIIKIIVTVFSSEEVSLNAADNGEDDFLVKPVKAEELRYTARKDGYNKTLNLIC